MADPSVHDEAHIHGSHPLEIIGWVLQHQGLIKPDVDPAKDPLTAQVAALKSELYLYKIAYGLDALAGSLACIGWVKDKFGPSRVGIVTTASNKELAPFIRRYDLGSQIGVIVCKEDTPPDKLKPDPFAYLLAAERFGLCPNECAALEDSPRGLKSACAAGFTAIGMTTTHTPGQLTGSADYVVDSFESVPRIIESLLKTYNIRNF